MDGFSWILYIFYSATLVCISNLDRSPSPSYRQARSSAFDSTVFLRPSPPHSSFLIFRFATQMSPCVIHSDIGFTSFCSPSLSFHSQQSLLRLHYRPRKVPRKVVILPEKYRQNVNKRIPPSDIDNSWDILSNSCIYSNA